MKRKTLLIVIALFLTSTFLINDCLSQWVQMSNGMGNDKSINSFAINGNFIFVGLSNNYGIYFSTNNGLNWTQTTLNDKSVNSLAVNGNNIYAGTGGYYGVFLSTNNGSNWSQTNLNNQFINTLRTNGNTIFAGTFNNGIYSSTNLGVNWIQSFSNNKPIYSIANFGNTIFAGSLFESGIGGFYVSNNNGMNWTQTSLAQTVNSITVSENIIYASTMNSGIYRSNNLGSSWTSIGLNNQIIYTCAVSGNNIIASVYDLPVGTGGVYLSSNNGVNWINKNQGFFSNIGVRALLIVNGYIFAGTENQSVWRREISEIIGIQNISTEIPSKYSISQNYPNPFNPTTNIKFDIVRTGEVKLIVYDVMGREVQTLVNESLKPGTYEALFDGSQLASGIYFYKFSAGDFSETKKMILIK